MEYSEIKQIIKDMEESKLAELEIEFKDGTKVKMKKDFKPPFPPQIPNIQPANIQAIVNNMETSAEPKEEAMNVVKSPMIGTFYSKPSPDSEPYVKVGDKVKKGDILCIIEAMKLMNEIECEYDGIVSEILVEDGKPVDYGKPLFKIK